MKVEIPVSINQIIDLKIDDLVHGGEGIGKYNNFSIFVPQSVPDDIVQIKIISIKPNYARGIIQKILQKSPLRIIPPCSITKECGGCQWQEIDYQYQLEYKEKQLYDNLSRIGEISKEILDTSKQKIIGMENPFYYRNKAIFPFALKNKKVIGGFYYPKTHNIVDLDKCYIQHDKINFVFKKVKELLSKYNISIYNETTHEGFFRNLLVRYAFKTDELLICLVTTLENFPKIKDFIQELKTIPNLTGIVQNINSEKTNFVLGKKNILLYGRDYIIEQLGNLKYKFSAGSFFQVNPVQTEVLYNTILDFANLTGNETVLDAYCGTGSISLWLAHKAKKVIGLESVKSSIEDAKENAKINNINNCEFIAGKVEELLPSVLASENIDTLVIDPPRKGCEKFVFETLAKFNIKKIIYVSCNPPTLARDSKLIMSYGYALKKFQPVDMFPHTYHLECVMKLEK